MPQKHPCWTRARAGRNRVLWVAYDDRPGTEDCQIIGKGDAPSLPEADAAARSVLASHGMYQARRLSTSFHSPKKGDEQKVSPSSRPPRTRPREYLYTRTPGDQDEFFVAAHLILKKTAKRSMSRGGHTVRINSAALTSSGTRTNRRSRSTGSNSNATARSIPRVIGCPISSPRANSPAATLRNVV